MAEPDRRPPEAPARWGDLDPDTRGVILASPFLGLLMISAFLPPEGMGLTDFPEPVGPVIIALGAACVAGLGCAVMLGWSMAVRPRGTARLSRPTLWGIVIYGALLIVLGAVMASAGEVTGGWLGAFRFRATQSLLTGFGCLLLVSGFLALPMRLVRSLVRGRA